MPTLDATFTWALPVHAARLGAHLEAYIEALPALDSLRACNRFGQGPRCHISKLPVELVQRITHYYILPIREAVFELWGPFLRCYSGTCTILDHYPKEALLQLYHKPWTISPAHDDKIPNPNDKELVEYLDKCRLDLEEGLAHSHNITEWQEYMVEECLTEQRRSLRKHFGLDIWLSNVCLGSSWCDYTTNHTTITYLILPDRAVYTNRWEVQSNYVGWESGCAMTVATVQHASPEILNVFKRAMNMLDLDIHVSDTQVEQGALSLESTKVDQREASTDALTSYPCPMLLVHHEISTFD